MPEAPLIRIAENPIPAAMTAEFLEGADGSRLRAAFLPRGEGAIGSCLVMPGWAEFIEKYREVGEDLGVRGLNVMICDPRGQGLAQKPQSGDRRGLITSYAKFRSDLDIYTAELKKRFPPPYIVLAHSMGALMVLDWLRENPDQDISALALSAPATRLFKGAVTRRGARAIASALCSCGLAAMQIRGRKDQSFVFEGNRLTHDPDRHERFRLLQAELPDACSGPPRVAWINATMAAGARLHTHRALESVRIPSLIVSPQDDFIVDASDHEHIAQALPSAELVAVPAAYHEVLMELDTYRDQFWEAFDQIILPPGRARAGTAERYEATPP